MTSGYTMLTILALMLLMVAVINANRTIVTVDVEPAGSVRQSVAVALAEELLGEIRTRRFDELAVEDSLVYTLLQFTYTLGPDVGAERDSCPLPDSGNYKSRMRYDDIDDYNGYSRIVDTWESQGYRLNVEVYYVNENDFTTRSYTQTYLKKIIVTVDPPDLAPMSFSNISVY